MEKPNKITVAIAAGHGFKTRLLDFYHPVEVDEYIAHLEQRAEAAEANANQLRADAVREFAHQQRVIADSLSGDTQRSHRITACRAEDYANQISPVPAADLAALVPDELTWSYHDNITWDEVNSWNNCRAAMLRNIEEAKTK